MISINGLHQKYNRFKYKNVFLIMSFQKFSRSTFVSCIIDATILMMFLIKTKKFKGTFKKMM